MCGRLVEFPLFVGGGTYGIHASVASGSATMVVRPAVSSHCIPATLGDRERGVGVGSLVEGKDVILRVSTWLSGVLVQGFG